MILTFLLKAKETKMLACRYLGAGQAMVPPSEHRRFGSGDTDRQEPGAGALAGNSIPWGNAVLALEGGDEADHSPSGDFKVTSKRPPTGGMGTRQEEARHHIPASVLGFKFMLELKLKALLSAFVFLQAQSWWAYSIMPCQGVPAEPAWARHPAANWQPAAEERHPLIWFWDAQFSPDIWGRWFGVLKRGFKALRQMSLKGARCSNELHCALWPVLSLCHPLFSSQLESPSHSKNLQIWLKWEKHVESRFWGPKVEF